MNRHRNSLPPLAVGTKVWYRRPEDSGDKLDTRWLGHAIVKEREGDQSYRVEVKPGFVIGAPRRFLKPWAEDFLEENPLPLFFHQRTPLDPDATPDEWEVERIDGHRFRGGKLQFLTRWTGWSEEERTWEPVGSFVHRYAAPFVKYCKENGLRIDVTEHLRTDADE